MSPFLPFFLYESSLNQRVFLPDPGKPGVLSMGPDVSPRPCVDLTDVTLANEDTKSILTDNVNRAIQGNVAMQEVRPGGWSNVQLMQVRHLVVKFATTASCVMWLPNLVQVTESISGSVVPLAMFFC